MRYVKSFFKVWIILLIPVLIFIALRPLTNQFTFPQNDDWVYRLVVERFIQRDFSLHWYLAPTFYTQGFIGMLYSLLFGIEKLANLTLFFSVTNLFLFLLYIERKFEVRTYTLVGLGFLYFFNPLNLYLSIGFMTEQYFLFFFFLTMHGLLSYDRYGQTTSLITAIMSSFFGLLVRQISLVVPLGYFLFNLVNKEYKKALIGSLWFGAFFLYLEKFFPKTQVMQQKGLQFHHLTDFDYSVNLLLGIGIVLSAFLFPIIISNVYSSLKKHKFKFKYVLFLALTGVAYVAISRYFEPQNISWGEFPYFENTFERTGFYPRGIHGTKYQFRGIFDLYMYWDLLAKIVFSMFLASLLFMKKRMFNMYTIMILAYMVVLLLAETFYDRYLILLLPLGILGLLEMYPKIEKLIKPVLFFFVFFLMFFGYQLTNDFVLTNKYVWETSEKISKEQSVDKEQILGTNAWKLSYKNTDREYLYNFSYDSQKINPDYANLYELVETHEIDFPGSIFINPKIYLYKVK